MADKLSDLVLCIFRLNDELNNIVEVQVDQALGRPASSQAIMALEVRLGHALPPSYRAFLSLHDGWQGFSTDLHLLSVEQQLDGPYADYVRTWKQEQWELGNAVAVEGIIVGIQINTNNARILDTTSMGADGEMEAVWWLDGELERYANFVEMLKRFEARLQRLIAREKEKRK